MHSTSRLVQLEALREDKDTYTRAVDLLNKAAGAIVESRSAHDTLSKEDLRMQFPNAAEYGLDDVKELAEDVVEQHQVMKLGAA